MSGFYGALTGFLVAGLAVFVWTNQERARTQVPARVFSAETGIRIVIPRDAVAAEQRAAELLRATLAKASALAEDRFPIAVEGAATGPAIFVGSTRRDPGFMRPAPAAPFDIAVGTATVASSIVVRSERREAVESAAAWFLERHLGARWFIPGPLGEVVPRRAELTIPAGREVVRPGFIARDLGAGSGEGRAWYARNRLETRFDHSHNLTEIFKPDDLRRVPEMAPMRRGQRHIAPAGDYNWQPDFLNARAIEHAAAVANRAFGAATSRLSYSLSENDSARFDDSAATLAAVEPARFFRTRPDYSDVVFHFANGVAERVARAHPERWLPTYAYYWAENIPRFPVARNVIPYLTSDRAQWFDPVYAAEDKRLMEQWGRSGAAIIGAYDYYYGSAFLIPRPITAAVSESIPFAHRAGVRAFYAEMTPNWALDGPKAWLAAQLLWSPTTNPATLLDTYYREFWSEAAEPMREFYTLCDRAWLEQPRPGYWIKYFQDEHQAGLFSPERRRTLRAQLDEARRRAQSPAVAARVEFVSAGFAVTEAFAEFCQARDELSRIARGNTQPAQLIAAAQKHRAAREEFERKNAAIHRDQPLALTPQAMDVFLRNDPTSRAAREFMRAGGGAALLAETPALVPAGANVGEMAQLLGAARSEMLRDAQWRAAVTRPIGPSSHFEWIQPGGAWQASGEPSEHRKVELIRQAGTTSPTPVLRYTGCRQEFIVQWLPATVGVLYAGQVKVRAKVSPGNQTFLIVNFLDEKQRLIGGGIIDRLPAGEGVQELDLCVVARAPANARFVGLGLRAINQVNDDFAEFSGASLRRSGN